MAKRKQLSGADSDLFRQSVGPVDRIRHNAIVFSPKSPRRIKHTANETDLAQQPVPLPDVAPTGIGDVLAYRRGGVQVRTLNRLRKGQVEREKTLDLHGMTAARAEQRLLSFLYRCRQDGTRCVRIIHGKGHGSQDRIPVIKNLLNRLLRGHDDVLAFSSAPVSDGGTGVLYLLLKKPQA